MPQDVDTASASVPGEARLRTAGSPHARASFPSERRGTTRLLGQAHSLTPEGAGSAHAALRAAPLYRTVHRFLRTVHAAGLRDAARWERAGRAPCVPRLRGAARAGRRCARCWHAHSWLALERTCAGQPKPTSRCCTSTRWTRWPCATMARQARAHRPRRPDARQRSVSQRFQVTRPPCFEASAPPRRASPAGTQARTTSRPRRRR